MLRAPRRTPPQPGLPSPFRALRPPAQPPWGQSAPPPRPVAAAGRRERTPRPALGSPARACVRAVRHFRERFPVCAAAALAEQAAFGVAAISFVQLNGSRLLYRGSPQPEGLDQGRRRRTREATAHPDSWHFEAAPFPAPAPPLAPTAISVVRARARSLPCVGAGRARRGGRGRAEGACAPPPLCPGNRSPHPRKPTARKSARTGLRPASPSCPLSSRPGRVLGDPVSSTQRQPPFRPERKCGPALTPLTPCFGFVREGLESSATRFA